MCISARGTEAKHIPVMPSHTWQLICPNSTCNCRPVLHAALEVETLWHDYEAQTTPESHLVKDFDKLEMIIQAHEYEQAQGLQLQQFFDTTKDKFKTQTGQAWAQELVARRQKAAVAPTTAAGEGSTAPAALQQAAAASQAGS
eukprot:GHRR01020982.1.p2 GENE.GHRR01020982.1~~GHRR01020982.1.p2  ORF type:complete len:143 (+),score=51.72 GHRR01020982.1:521-949(+)